MIHVDLSKELQLDYEALSAETGTSVEDHVREALIRYLEDREDLAAAEAALARIEAGEPTISLADMKARLGLEG